MKDKKRSSGWYWTLEKKAKYFEPTFHTGESFINRKSEEVGDDFYHLIDEKAIPQPHQVIRYFTEEPFE